ncbi:MAG: 50S ribosomal protein L9 [Desulfotomaculaceae bacterium]|nr:50S ribosomal protein L9 [Desulfotomaculaceae bacterium]
MKVILLKDVLGQGRQGDVVNVAEGYARNYLLPRGLASKASQGKLREIDDRRKSAMLKKEKIEHAARELAASLNGLTVTVRAKTGEAGKLFGSVNNKDIAEALAEQHKITLDKKKLVVREPIKQLGSYSITAKLHPAVQAKIFLEVVEE